MLVKVGIVGGGKGKVPDAKSHLIQNGLSYYTLNVDLFFKNTSKKQENQSFLTARAITSSGSRVGTIAGPTRTISQCFLASGSDQGTHERKTHIRHDYLE